MSKAIRNPLGAAALFVLALAIPISARADRCLVVYPASPTEYHYDVNEYYTVSMGDSLYDPAYDRGGEVLIDINDDEIAYDIYQAPDITGFKPSSDGQEGYFTLGNRFDLVIDGFNNEPTVYENIVIVFDPDPAYCSPYIEVDGDPVSGSTYPVGDLVVSTPTQNGNNYSDTMTLGLYWDGCYGVRIWAYADENYNGIRDGGECFTSFSHDITVPATETTWGAIKNMYEE